MLFHILYLKFDVFFQTPLHYAVQKKKNVKVTNALLRLGANPNACDDKGMSPLLTAVQGRLFKIIC